MLFLFYHDFPGLAQPAKNLPANAGDRETQFLSLGWEDTLEKEMATHSSILDFPGVSDSKASAYNAGDPGLIPGLGRYSGEGNGNLLQYSCLENPTCQAPLSMNSQRVRHTE